jgi:hypothetical protein
VLQALSREGADVVESRGMHPADGVAAASRALDLRVSSRLLGGGNPSWHLAGSWENAGLEGRSLHHGRPPEPELATAASQRGYALVGRSQPLVREDLDQSQVVVVLGEEAMSLLSAAALAWGGEDLRVQTEQMARLVPGNSTPRISAWRRGEGCSSSAEQLVGEAEALCYELLPFFRQKSREYGLKGSEGGHLQREGVGLGGLR